MTWPSSSGERIRIIGSGLSTICLPFANARMRFWRPGCDVGILFKNKKTWGADLVVVQNIKKVRVRVRVLLKKEIACQFGRQKRQQNSKFLNSVSYCSIESWCGSKNYLWCARYRYECGFGSEVKIEAGECKIKS